MAFPWYKFRLDINCFVVSLLIGTGKNYRRGLPGEKVSAVSPLLVEVHARWRKIFTVLHAGSDLSPALQLRTEGLMEAVVLTREATAEELGHQMAQVYAEVYGQPIADFFAPDWQLFYPFPQIPAAARRAPVYPSTTD
jgi:hypothetical protein